MPLTPDELKEYTELKELKELRRLKAEATRNKRMKEEGVGQSLGEKFVGGLQDIADFTSALAPKVPVVTSGAEYLADAARAGLDPNLTFGQAREQTLGKRQRLESEYPIASLGGNVLGAVGAPIAAPVATAAKVAGPIARGAINAASRIGTAAVESGADAALLNRDGEEAAKTGAAFSAGFEGLGAIGKGIGKIAGPTIFGVRKEAEAAYRARPDAIRNIDEGAVKQELDQTVQGFRDEVDTARQGLEKTRGNVKERLGVINKSLATRYDDAATEAKENMLKFVENAKPTVDDAEALVNAGKKVRGIISEKSGEAFEILNNTGKTIPTSRIKAFLTQKANELKVAGQDLNINSGDYDLLLKLRSDMDSLPKDMRPEDMKRLVQALDAKISDIYDAASRGAGYVTRGDKAAMDVRRFIDQSLKEDIPEYAEHMKEVSELTKVMNQFNDFYSNPAIAQKNLKAAQTDSFQQRALKQFDEASGNNFAKDTALKAEMSGIQKAEELARLKRIKESNFQRQQAARRGGESRIAKAESELESAQTWLEPVGNIRPNTSEGYLRAAGDPNRANAGAKLDSLRYIDELKGTQFQQQAQDLGVKRAFDQGFTRGSRNVNLAQASLGGALGAVGKFAGSRLDAAGDIGKAIGAMAGAVIDTVGPKTYQKIIDIDMMPGFQRAKYALKQAAQRNPNAVILTHYLLQKDDPEYRAYTEGTQP